MADINSSERIWLIWSNYHRAWWRPFRTGHTGIAGAAGRYSFKEATEICDGANRCQSKNEIPNEVMFLAPEAVNTLMGNIDKIPVHEVEEYAP